MVVGSIHETFSTPFYTGSVALAVDDTSFPVSIDGRPFQIDLALGYPNDHFHRASVQLLNTQQAQTGGDQANVPPEVWRRNVESWHQGGGQSRLDRTDSLPYQYHQSTGIDPWQKFGFNLLHETSNLFTLTAGQQAILCAIDVQLFTAIGTTVRYYATTGTAPTSHTSPATVLAMVTDGENLYTLCSNGVVEKRDSAGTWTTFYTVASMGSKYMLAFTKGRLLVGNGPILLDITAATTVTIYTHPLTSWWWRDCAEGLNVVYVLGGIGDHWHIHRIGIDPTTTLFQPPIVAASLPEGEIGYSIATYLGFVLIGSHYGWRFGTPDNSGAITYGRLTRTAGPVICFEGQDRFVWFGLSFLSGQTTTDLYTTVAGIGRTDLSTFTNTDTPASAADLMGTDYGVTRSIVTVGGSLDAMGHRVFSVDGVGIFVEQDTLVTTGWLTSGILNFNSTDKKMGLYAQVFHDPLAGGTVEFDTSADFDLGGFQILATNTSASSSSIGNIPYPNAFYTVEMRVKLTRSTADTTKGPRITRLEFRALDVPGRSSEWHIPLQLTEDSISEGSQYTRDVADDYSYLMSLVETRKAFTYREGQQTWTLHATDFTWAPLKLTSDGRSYQGTFVIIARELT